MEYDTKHLLHSSRTVNGIKGLLILPCDNSDATKAKEILSTVGISQDDISSIKLGQTDALDYTKIVPDSNNQLTAMNSVFLPLAGYSSPSLNGEKNSGLTVYYWASSGSYRAAAPIKLPTDSLYVLQMKIWGHLTSTSVNGRATTAIACDCSKENQLIIISNP